ncbi:MAG TPA: hypothetical protein ENN40_10320 [Candidatus Aminicenantes bacterium]|nr:hypothetical protein [Candidatus Aminicenantes bacterium]
MISTILFYVASFFISFFLCIPIGPVNLEILHTALKKHYVQALSISAGAALGDAVWATCAFFGISPFMSSRYMEASFFLFTTIITAVLGLVALKDARFIEKKEEKLVTKIRRKRWAVLKGLAMVLVNPLGIVSWMVSLSFLSRVNVFIPMELRYEVIFFVVVTAGAMTYFSLIVFIASRMKALFSPSRTRKIIRFLGFLLLAFSLYFFYHAIELFFFNGTRLQLSSLVQ